MAKQQYSVYMYVDKKEFDRQMREVNARFSELERTATKSGSSIDSTFKKIGAGIAGYFAIGQMQNFAREVIKVRKEMEQLEISFKTLTGSEKAGKAMYDEIVKFGQQTPLLEKDLAKAAQTMLAFNIEQEKVVPLLKQFGDISMGDAQKLQSLALAFSQTSSTGKLMGQDLLQMINAGFNPLAEIARKTGRDMGELKEEMSEGKISVEMVEDAFKSATSEGGKFHGMLTSMGDSMGGALSNLEGSLDKFYNRIGELTQDSVVEGAKMATEALDALTENIEEVASAVGQAIVMFGSYKAACMVAATANNVAAASAAGYSIKTQLLRKQVQLMQVAQALLNKTMLTNPYVLAGVAIGALGIAIYKVATAATGAELAVKDFNKELEETKRKQEELNGKIEEAIALYQDDASSVADRERALYSLGEEYRNIFRKYIDEKGHLRDLIGLKRELAALEGKERVSSSEDKAQKYARYAEILEKKNVTSEELPLLKEANKEFDNAHSWTEEIANDFKSRAEYFRKKSQMFKQEAGNQRTQNSVDDFINSIADRDKEDAKNWQKVLQNAQKRLGGKYKRVRVAGLGDVNAEQIESMLSQLDKRINPKSTTSSKKGKEKTKKTTDNSIKEIERANDTILSMQQANEDAEVALMQEGKEKQLAQLKLAHKHKLAEIQRHEEEIRKARGGELTEDDANTLNKAKLLSEQRYNAEVAKIEREHEQERRASMYAYLQEYGDAEQKRYAITKEYEEKIAELRKQGASAWDIASMQEEMNARLSQLDATDAFAKLDWDNLFTELASHTKEYLVGVRDQLQELLSSGSLTSIEDIERVQARLDELNTEINKKGGLLNFVGDRQREQNRRENAAETARQELSAAKKEESKALGNYWALQMTGASQEKLIEAETALRKAREKTAAATQKAQKTEDAAKRTSSQAVADWFADAEQFIAEKGIDQLPALLDKFGMGEASERVSAGLSGFHNASAAAADFASGNYIGAAIKGLSALSDFGTALGVNFSADYSAWEAAVAKYSDLCDVWADVLSEQRSLIDEARGAFETLEAYEKAVKTTQNYLDAQRAMGKARLSSGAGAGSHSLGYRMWQGSYKSAYGRNWQDVAAQLGISSMSDLLYMDADALKDIRAEYSDLWASLDEEFRQILENIIQYSEEAEAMAEKVNEKLTHTSFDGMRDEFLKSLTDMSGDAESFAKWLERTMFEAMVDSYVLDEEFNEWLKDWQKRYAEAMKENDANRLAALQKEAQDVRNAKVNERNEIAAALGYDPNSSQSATANAITSITADQANQLVGRVTAMQIAVERMMTLNESLNVSARDAANKMTQGLTLMEDNNMLVQRCANHLESISEYTSVLPAMSEEITRLRTITEARL